MFLSTYKRKLTQGGRTAVPEEYRDELGDRFIIALPLSEKACLTIYTMRRFEDIFNTLDELGEDVDVFTAHSQPVACDSQFRFTIPQELRDTKDGSPFDEEILFVGAGSEIEMWCPGEWKWRKENGNDGTAKRAALGEALNAERKRRKQS